MIYVVTNCEGKIRPIAKAFTTDSAAAPIGSITPGFVEDDRWMFCEGQSLAKKEYPALFDIIGYTYGGEDDYFNLPDMREYVPVGAGKRTSNTSEEMVLGRCYASQFNSHNHSQGAHCHCRPAHTHTGVSHSHSGNSHTHTYVGGPTEAGSAPNTGSGSYNSRWCQTCTFPSNIYGSTSTSNGGTSSSNSDGNLNAATASNCSTGATSGGTHGRRYGMRYIIRVA